MIHKGRKYPWEVRELTIPFKSSTSVNHAGMQAATLTNGIVKAQCFIPIPPVISYPHVLFDDQSGYIQCFQMCSNLQSTMTTPEDSRVKVGSAPPKTTSFRRASSHLPWFGSGFHSAPIFSGNPFKVSRVVKMDCPFHST